MGEEVLAFTQDMGMRNENQTTKQTRTCSFIQRSCASRGAVCTYCDASCPTWESILRECPSWWWWLFSFCVSATGHRSVRPFFFFFFNETQGYCKTDIPRKEAFSSKFWEIAFRGVPSKHHSGGIPLPKKLQKQMREDVCCFKASHDRNTSTRTLLYVKTSSAGQHFRGKKMAPVFQFVCQLRYLSSRLSLLIKMNGSLMTGAVSLNVTFVFIFRPNIPLSEDCAVYKPWRQSSRVTITTRRCIFSLTFSFRGPLYLFLFL